MPAINIPTGTPINASTHVAPLLHGTALLVLTIILTMVILLLGVLGLYTTIHKRRATTPIDVEATAPVQASDTTKSFACASSSQFVKDGLLSSEEDINQRMVVLVKRMSVESVSLPSLESEKEKDAYITSSDSFIPYQAPISPEVDEQAALPVVTIESYDREEVSSEDENGDSSVYSVDISMNVQPSSSIDLLSECLSAGEPAMSPFWNCQMNLCLASGLKDEDDRRNSYGAVVHLPVFDPDVSLGGVSQICGLPSTSSIDNGLRGFSESPILDLQESAEDYPCPNATHDPRIERDCSIDIFATDIPHPSLFERKPRQFIPRPSRLRHVETIEEKTEIHPPVTVPATPRASTAKSPRRLSKLRPLLLCQKASPPASNLSPKGNGKKAHGRSRKTEDKENSPLSNAA